MDEALNTKYKQVQEWLENIHNGGIIPQYEISEQTVNILHKIVCCNKEAEQDVSLLLKDWKQKTEEYYGEARRINEILQNVGISFTSFSVKGQSDISSLSSAACVLGLKDASTTSFLLKLSKISQQTQTVEDMLREGQTQSTNLLKKTKSALVRTQQLKQKLGSVNEWSKNQESQLHKKKKQTVFLFQKIQEYTKSINQLEHQLHDSGIDPTLYHKALVKKAEKIAQLKEKLIPLSAKLRSYHDLPPDEDLAKVKIEESQQELAKLQKEIFQNIDLVYS